MFEVAHILPIAFGTPEMDESVRLRYEVLRKPLGMEYTPDQIAEEAEEIHLGAYDHHWELLGSLILKPLGDKVVKMRQVAVAEAHQGTGVGKALVYASEQMAQEMGFQKITLHARDVAVPFYLKLGYQKVGDKFFEVGIEHWEMEREL